MVGFEFGQLFLDADTGGDGEPAQKIVRPAVLRRDEIGQAVIGAAIGLVHLLAQEMDGGGGIIAVVGGIDFDIVVVDARGREEADHGPRGKPFLGDDLFQHGAGVGKQVARRRALLGVLKDCRVDAF